MVASPEPIDILDSPAVLQLIGAGFVVVANGGGGIPVVRREDGSLSGVEAVIDKDLGAALLGVLVGADLLVVATDVPQAVLRFGAPDAQPLGRIGLARMQEYAEEGHFASGSMGPKVDAVCRFVQATDKPAVITSLDRIVAAVTDVGTTGTVVVAD